MAGSVFDGEGDDVTYARDVVAKKQDSWEAFCRAENYDPNDTAMWVAYRCGWQDGWHQGDEESDG